LRVRQHAARSKLFVFKENVPAPINGLEVALRSSGYFLDCQLGGAPRIGIGQALVFRLGLKELDGRRAGVGWVDGRDESGDIETAGLYLAARRSRRQMPAEKHTKLGQKDSFFVLSNEMLISCKRLLTTLWSLSSLGTSF
jgi:hypothetical protein